MRGQHLALLTVLLASAVDAAAVTQPASLQPGEVGAPAHDSGAALVPSSEVGVLRAPRERSIFKEPPVTDDGTLLCNASANASFIVRVRFYAEGLPLRSYDPPRMGLAASKMAALLHTTARVDVHANAVQPYSGQETKVLLTFTVHAINETHADGLAVRAQTDTLLINASTSERLLGVPITSVDDVEKGVAGRGKCDVRFDTEPTPVPSPSPHRQLRQLPRAHLPSQHPPTTRPSPRPRCRRKRQPGASRRALPRSIRQSPPRRKSPPVHRHSRRRAGRRRCPRR